MRLTMVAFAGTLAFALAAPSTAQPLPRTPPAPVIGKKVCEQARPRLATGGLLWRGGDAATYDLHLAVVRTVDGCIVPAILRRDVDQGRSGGVRAPDDKQSESKLLRPL